VPFSTLALVADFSADNLSKLMPESQEKKIERVIKLFSNFHAGELVSTYRCPYLGVQRRPDSPPKVPFVGFASALPLHTCTQMPLGASCLTATAKMQVKVSVKYSYRMQLKDPAPMCSEPANVDLPI